MIDSDRRIAARVNPANVSLYLPLSRLRSMRCQVGSNRSCTAGHIGVTWSCLLIAVQAGQSYAIQLDGAGGTQGTGKLHVTLYAGNDNIGGYVGTIDTFPTCNDGCLGY